MNFRFDSLQAFFEMAGHGGYVWGCYSVCFAGLIFLVVQPLLQRKKFFREQALLVRRKKAQTSSLDNKPVQANGS